MAATIPYTYFQCPCAAGNSPTTGNPDNTSSEGNDEREDDNDFDPRAPRSNYSLYPLEHLLYCEDCQEIKCQKCVLDEIVTWFCPNCLFEVPSSTVKSEGNRYDLPNEQRKPSSDKQSRCTRSCFQCPLCISPLSVNSLESQSAGLLGAEQAAPVGPWVLACGYCNWSSEEIGIKFTKPNGVYNQLLKIKNGGEAILPLKEQRERDEARRNISNSLKLEGVEEDTTETPVEDESLEARFSKLKSFYQTQLAETTGGNPLSFSGDYGYGSPAALSRIMGLYTGGSYADKKSKNKTGTMREAYEPSEGFHLCPQDDNTIINKLRTEGWSSTTSQEQRSNQTPNTRFISDIRPVPYLLRTKRSKRCKTCRHILSKPESKVQTTRFRICLAAKKTIPSIRIKPLSPAPALPAGAPPPLLKPLKPTQFLLTITNVLFDPIKITLATPTHTPGRFSSKITILCPQFEVGAKQDEWTDALGDDRREKRRTTKELGDGQVLAEAGKVWEKGQNWVSVVVEVVPASLQLGRGLAALRGGEENRDDEQIMEDEDILEIPVFVRVDWETEAGGDDAGKEKEKDVKERRELAYWCVLGVGRIAQEQI
jgi:dynactin-4